MSSKHFLTLVTLCYCCIFVSSRVIEDLLNDYAHIKSHASPIVQEQAVRDLISRLLPEYTSYFHITVDPSLSGNANLDMFEYQSHGSKLFIKGTTGVACSLGVNHFLKYYCKAHVSWSGDQLNIPTPFPTVSTLVTVRVPYRWVIKARKLLLYPFFIMILL